MKFEEKQSPWGQTNDNRKDPCSDFITSGVIQMNQHYAILIE